MTSHEDALPYDLKPSPFVREFAGTLFKHGLVEASILDVGCGEGRNSRYLAGQGHKVIGVDVNESDLQIAYVLAAQRKLGNAACSFIAGDVSKLPFRGTFDAIISNEVLHMLPKTESKATLSRLRDLTRPGGLHAISGYLRDNQLKNLKNINRTFAPEELRHSYINVGWRILEYVEDVKPPLVHNKVERVSSTVRLIARRPDR